MSKNTIYDTFAGVFYFAEGNLTMTTGERIKDLRIRNGLTQSELAKKAGCSAQVISNIERGYSGLSADLATRISDLFNIPADELMRDRSPSEDILTLEEKALIKGFRQLSARDRDIVLNLCGLMANAK